MAYSRGRCLLQYWLNERGISQTDLAERSGWSVRMVSYWCKTERMMSVDAMYTVSTILEVHMEDLYQWIITAD
ncbi:helix-turn-helix domain-containing protein [Paenibacillus terrae]|uniref:helix-turn-helix domain-containing protein n=1 Tax=Paenibacillus terrae TaxID=159743 RepID=UPI0009E37650|nr:helix-turn-helix transcriptional regulator [Paenibacillus terrae]